MTNFYVFTRTVIYSILFLFVFFSATAQQKIDRQVTLNLSKASAARILQSIMKQTAVRIVYNQELIKKIPAMDFKASNEELQSAVKRLLNGSGLTFVMQDDVMIISPKEETNKQNKRSGVVKGQVLDDKGEPLSSVTVSVLGRSGTIFTNRDGNFTLRLDEGNLLVFSYIGFKSKTIEPAIGEVVNVKLESEQNDMEEVVINGYQTVSKRTSASSTYTLKGSEIQEAGYSNIASMLQGKVPGLVVSKPSGSPNATPSMRLRGTSTLIGNANPIFVVDGVVRENPNDINPDNPMADLSTRDRILMLESLQASNSLTGNSINDLDIEDVETITFLKDASATAIYGTRAANGVIVVTTKKGKAGPMQISYNTSFGTSTKPSYGSLKLMNSQQRIRFSRELYEDGYIYRNATNIGYENLFQDFLNRKLSESEFQSQVTELEQVNTDWFDLLFRNSLNMKHHLSFSGGSEKTNYYSSIGFNDNQGTAKLDGRTSGSVNAGLTFKLNRKLDFRIDLNGSYRSSSGYFSVNPLSYALQTSRAIPSSVFYLANRQGFFGETATMDYNIINELNQTGNSTKESTISGTFNLNYLAFRGLSLSSMVGVNTNSMNSEQYATELSNYVALQRGYNYGTVAPGSAAELKSGLPFGGLLYNRNSSVFSYNVRNMAVFNRSVFSEDDQLNISAGQDLTSASKNGFNTINPGYLRDRGESFNYNAQSIGQFNPSKINTINNSFSLFGTASYSYAGKYTLNANIRTDASNRFGQFSNQRFLPVWSVAAMWNMGEENWLKDNKILNALNLRGSYGFQGNVITSVGPELVLTLPSIGISAIPGFNEYELNIKSLPYPDLRWEKTRSVNLELSGSLFQSFANFTLGYYHKLTTDAITTKFIPLEYGVSSMLINGGNIKNYGYELTLGLNLIKRKDLQWNLSLNAAKNYNVLQKGTVDQTNTLLYDYLEGRALMEDQPINTFYVFSFKGLDAQTGVPLFYGIDDDGPKTSSFLDYIKPAGSRLAKLNGGLGTTVSYGAFSLHGNFAFSLGGKRLRNGIYKKYSSAIPNPDQNLPEVFEERWRKPGDEALTDIPAYPKSSSVAGIGYANLGGNFMNRYEMYNYSDVNVVSSSYLRCNSLNLSYRLASIAKRLRLRQLSVTGTASNLFVIADKKLRGEDPEIDGVGTTALPVTKNFTLGINVGF